MQALKVVMQRQWRRKRMRAFCIRLGLADGMTVLDLGGTPEMWQYTDLQLKVTILNLPHVVDFFHGRSNPDIAYVKGDACCAPFSDRSFDVVFSNSVIEHIPQDKHPAFAANVLRLAPSWWVQTPSIRFPLEAHCNLPFWWSYPESFKEHWIGRWERAGNIFLANQMQSTLGLDKDYYLKLFGNCEIYIERTLGFEKSISIYAHR